MSREKVETSYSNESHMDLLSASEEECAVVPQGSPRSEDLDDSIVTFGQQDSEKENVEKKHYVNLFKQESCSEEEMSYNNPGRTEKEPQQIAEHPGEKVFCNEQSMWHEEEEEEEETAFGQNLMKNIKAKSKLRRIRRR